MHDELKEAIAKIQQAAKENEKSTGIYSTTGDQAREFADQGFNMVSFPLKQGRLPPELTTYPFLGICYDRCSCASCIHDFLIDGRQGVVRALSIEHGQGSSVRYLEVGRAIARS